MAPLDQTPGDAVPTSDTMNPPTPASRAESAYRQLRDSLMFLDIAPGSPLNEQALSVQFDVGRTPLREAIKRLENEHLVITYPRRGTFATPVDTTALSEISTVREALEPLAARLAAEHIRPSSRERLDRTITQLLELSASTSPREHIEMDRLVHLEIYSAARNAHLAGTLEDYLHLALRIWNHALGDMNAIGAHIDEHVEILTAIRDGDPDRASDLMLTHVHHFDEAIRPAL